MSNESEYYQKSLLAEAAYAELNDGLTSDQTAKLKESGLSDDQIAEFLQTWTNVNSYHSLLMGLRVNVFSNPETHEVCIAIAGTNSPLDIIIPDSEIALGLKNSQYPGLSDFYESLIQDGVITGSDHITAAGHSLGGFLAQLLTLEYADISETYTYNSPGFGGIWSEIGEYFGFTQREDFPGITNIRGDGLSVTASLGTMYGDIIEVQIENSSLGIPNHFAAKLSDSLAIYDTLWQLDSSFSFEQYADVFKSGSNEEMATLERVVDMLRSLFGISATPLEVADGSAQRDALLSAIYGIRNTDTYNTLINNASVQSSMGVTGQQAANDFGAFLAVHYFSPVYIAGAALEEPNQDLYSQWSSGEFSSQYLEDRAAMLRALLGANATDMDYDDVRGVYFSDAETGAIIGTTSDGFFSPDNRKIVFGDDGSDNLSGGTNNDHLYGGGGNDSLYGGAGSDYLEGGDGDGDDVLNPGVGFDRLNGGTGNDTYQISLNDFGDAIISGDTDGGTISLLNGITFRRVGEGGANTNGLYIAVDANGDWQNGKEGWSVSVSGSTATVFVKDGDSKQHVIAIENFNISSNHFGIQFDKMPTGAAPTQTNVYTVGDGTNFLQQKLDAAPDDPFEGRSLIYNAVDYLYQSGADVDENGQITGPINSETAISYYFEGGTEADVLNGNNWRSTQQAAVGGGDSMAHIAGYASNNVTGWIGDIIGGGDGDDMITGDGKRPGDSGYDTDGDNDILIGGRGNDTIYGGAGDDTLFAWQAYTPQTFASSQALATTLDYDHNLYGSVQEAIYKGAVTIETVGEKNTLYGGAGNDTLYGASYDDFIDGGSGHDFILAGAGRDTIDGGTGNDVIYGDSFYVQTSNGGYTRDFIAPDRTPTNNYARGYFYRENTDMDTVFNPDTDYNDIIDGGDGGDYIFGEIGSDIISGGAGNDVLFGDRSYSAGFFQGNNPNETVPGFQPLSARYHGDDVIDGGDGDDKIIGGGGNDRLLGGNGNDIIYGDLGLGVYDYRGSGAVANDPIQGIKASDVGWWGNDVLIGGAGNDTLVGEGGDDTLDGGDGDDIIYGDWANWQTAAFSDSNAKAGNDTLYGGAGNDQLMGNGGNDTLYGGSGNDKLFGDSYSNGGLYTDKGDDYLDGGEGDDTLYGGAGNDTLIGGTGNDTLVGGEGEDVYVFGAGSGVDVVDDTWGQSTLRLASAPIRTVLQGSSAIIYLSKDGSNRIHLSKNALLNINHVYVDGEAIDLNIDIGSGFTGGMGSMAGNQIYTITDDYTGGTVLYDTEGENTLAFASGWKGGDGYLDVSLWSGNGYQFKNASNPAIRASVSPNAVLALHDVISASGEAINLRITAPNLSSYSYELHGFSGDDIITGSNGEDRIWGDVGNDTIKGGAGHDELYGGEGDDILLGGDGADFLFGGAGNDTLNGGTGSRDILHGEEGDDVLYLSSGGDIALGGGGNDTFIPEANSSSYVRGEAGSDTFIVNSSNNSFYEITDQYFDAGDVIQLDFNADRIHLTAQSIGIVSEDGLSIRPLLSFMQYTLPEGYWLGMENLTLRFADGTLWGIDEMKPIIQTATNVDDVLMGDAGANLLQGLDGNDTIYGADGDDTLYGNAGNDTLVGGAGNDVFHFGLGDGFDMVRERDTARWITDADTVWLESGIREANVALSIQSNNLEIKLKATDETLTLEHFFDDAESNERHLSLSFNGGTTYAWDSEYIQKEIFKGAANRTQRGTPTTGNNSITGTYGNDYIYGDAGNDTLNGGNGSDWLDGGTGNDILTGGAGSDTYRFGVGSGHDMVTDSATNIAADTVRLDFTVAIGDLTLQLINGTSDLLIGRHDANGTVTDTIQVNKALGHLVGVKGNELLVEEGGNTLLGVVSTGLVGKTLTLTKNPDETRYVALSASEILGMAVSDDERGRWQITDATPLSGRFAPDVQDVDGDGNTEESSFIYIENLWNSGTNYVGFIPNTTAGNASFSFTLRRDDGLTIQSVMQVVVQTNTGTLTGTSNADVLDGSQSDTPLVIMGGAGNDTIYDGYGDDIVYGGDGNDRLTFGSWAGNGNDIFDGGAGDDVLDAGWGNDLLIGGAGNDLYIEGNLWSGDHTTIDNSGGAESDVDTLQIGSQGYGLWDYRSLWFTRDGSDLLVDQLDELADGEIRIKNWYADTDTNGDGVLNDAGAGRLDIFVAQQDNGAVFQANGNSGNFDALINAMAQFGAKPASVSDAANALQEEYQAAWMQLAVPAAA
ncbi:MAG: hypothetical protein U1F12_02845 [Pseudomonadales bacterium]